MNQRRTLQKTLSITATLAASLCMMCSWTISYGIVLPVGLILGFLSLTSWMSLYKGAGRLGRGVIMLLNGALVYMISDSLLRLTFGLRMLDKL